MKARCAAPDPLDFLRRSELRQALPDGTLRLLASQSRIRYVRRHDVIARRGEVVEGLILIASGAIRTGTISENGREVGFGVVTPGHIWGVVSVLDGEGCVHDIYACSDSTLIVIPTPVVHALLEEHPILYRSFNTMLCYRLRRAYSSINETGLSSLRQRLARQLCLLYKSGDQGAVSEPIQVTQEQLAVLVGATRPRVNRELAALQKAGVVRVSYRGITVLNYEGLQRSRSLERLFYM